MAILGIQVEFQGWYISLRVLTSLFLVEIFHFGGVFFKEWDTNIFLLRFLALLRFEHFFGMAHQI